MVNDVVLSYIEKHKGEFPMKDIRAKILSRGYSKEDVDEAVKVLGQKKEVVLEKGVNPKKNIVLRESGGRKKGFKWMKMAGVIGLVFFVLAFVSFVLGLFEISVSSVVISAYVMIGIMIVLLVMLFFYFYGFLRMGRSVDSKLLRVASVMNIIMIVLIVISIVVMTVIMGILLRGMIDSVPVGLSGGFDDFGNIAVTMPTGNVVGGSVFPWWAILVIVLYIGFIIFSILARLLFSIALVRVRKKVGFSLLAGIFGLAALVLGLVSVGMSFYYVYYISNVVGALVNPFVSSPLWMVYTIVWSGIIASVSGVVALLFESLSLLSGSKKFE